jgi:hypothetical protein
MSTVQTEANRLLDATLGTAAYTAPTGPVKVALMTVAGSSTAAGTEVTGGSYARQSVTFSSASAAATANTGLLRWNNLPACTVVGIELYDSAGTPRRIAFGALSASKTVAAGDSLEIAIGALTASMT